MDSNFSLEQILEDNKNLIEIIEKNKENLLPENITDENPPRRIPP